MYEKCTPKEIISIATSISLTIINCKSFDEICAIKNIVSIILANLNAFTNQAIICEKHLNCNNKKSNQN